MKLYTTPGGQWTGTEKDWKAALKSEGVDPKTYAGPVQVEVPTSKPGLLEFLTFHNVNVINPASAGVEAVGGAALPPAAPPAAPDLDALRALHNPGAIQVSYDVAELVAPPTTVPHPGPEHSVTATLDEAFRAAPIPKQVELAVNLLDRLEIAARHVT